MDKSEMRCFESSQLLLKFYLTKVALKRFNIHVNCLLLSVKMLIDRCCNHSFLWTVLKCLESELFSPNFAWHRLQSKGFKFKWTLFLCLLRPDTHPNLDWQMLHSKGLRFLCTSLLCLLRFEFVPNLAWHMLHSNGLMLPCTLEIWHFRCELT